MEEEVANFYRAPTNLSDLSDLYERIPEPVVVETSQTDEEFYKFRSSAKSKHRSLSLPPIRGNFVLINRMMNCTPLNKFRFGQLWSCYITFPHGVDNNAHLLCMRVLCTAVWLCNILEKGYRGKATRKMLIKLTYGVDFINIFSRLFISSRLRCFFAKQRLANGALIWRISPHILGEFHRQSLRQFGVNFINVKHTNFLYEHRFGSFFYVHGTIKKTAKTTFVRKICT